MLRDNHYDVAFEGFLRRVRTPYVVVDESRRALLSDASLKSMDFIVYSSRAENLLVDVKGRRFPSGGEAGGHKWENWATAEDLDSLLSWQTVFGTGFRATLVFAYDIVDDSALPAFDEVFEFRNRKYAFFGVWADDYAQQMRTRSRSWDTVSLPTRIYAELRKPIAQLL